MMSTFVWRFYLASVASFYRTTHSSVRLDNSFDFCYSIHTNAYSPPHWTDTSSHTPPPPPRRTAPPSRSTSWWYASYWNAFLFKTFQFPFSKSIPRRVSSEYEDLSGCFDKLTLTILNNLNTQTAIEEEISWVLPFVWKSTPRHLEINPHKICTETTIY